MFPVLPESAQPEVVFFLVETIAIFKAIAILKIDLKCLFTFSTILGNEMQEAALDFFWMLVFKFVAQFSGKANEAGVLQIAFTQEVT